MDGTGHFNPNKNCRGADSATRHHWPARCTAEAHQLNSARLWELSDGLRRLLSVELFYCCLAQSDFPRWPEVYYQEH